MKKILCLCCLLTVIVQCYAQGIFSQKKTQTKYMLQQIAKLQIYLGYAKKGYNIVNKGLTTISHIKNGDFNLHKAFFTSLETVNPQIKNYSGTKSIIALIPIILEKDEKIRKLLSSSSKFVFAEQQFASSQLRNMRQQLQDDLNQLADILTNNTLQMRDEQRLQQIDKIHQSVFQKEDWISGKLYQCQLLYQQRSKENTDINTLKNLYSPL